MTQSIVRRSTLTVQLTELADWARREQLRTGETVGDPAARRRHWP
jgi:hypothetical protein